VRLGHWICALSLLFLATSGLNIFMAHPSLHIGVQTGFEFDNAVLAIGAVRGEELRGVTEILGRRFDTTGVLGVSDGRARAIPAWATTPSFPDLATARVIHFFFAWTFVAALALWLGGALATGHLRRELVPRRTDPRAFLRQLGRYLQLDFRTREPGCAYNGMQKVCYATVLLILLPLMVLTGLAMSPAANAIFPPLSPMLGGRETARTLHFVVMVVLAAFAVIHVGMVLLSKPVQGLRSMLTGWCADPEASRGDGGERRP
jgi:thiosulfate reductase cytochrome b subunit